MNDVARRAGVSLKTVSRVVNGAHHVAPLTAEKVTRAIKELNYELNELARGLRGGDSATIGLIVTDIGNPFYGQLARAVEKETGNRLLLVASSSEQPELEERLVRRFAQRHVDGLLLVPTCERYEHLSELTQSGIPVVFVDRAPDASIHDAVTLDNRYAAASAVRRLTKTGARRIALVGLAPHTYGTGARTEGYRIGLRDCGVEFDDSLLLLNNRDEGDARESLLARLDAAKPPDAILATNNVMAIGAIHALLERGLRWPVAAFDQVALSQYLPLNFLTIRNDPTSIGSTAVSLLRRRINGDDSPPQVHLLRPEIEETAAWSSV